MKKILQAISLTRATPATQEKSRITRVCKCVIIAMAFLIAIIPATSVAVYAAPPGVGVKIDLVQVAGDVHKLVFQAMTPSRIYFMETIMSFDNTAIVPVFWESPEFEIPIANGARSEDMFKLIARHASTPLPAFDLRRANWRVVENRTAFLYTLISSLSYYVESGEYKDIFEFYFKVLPGKSVNDAAFRIENGAYENSFVPIFVPVGDGGAGITIGENLTAGSQIFHYYGSEKPDLKPTGSFSELWLLGTQIYPDIGCRHDFTTVTVPATCLEDGSVTTTCALCDYRDVTVVGRLGHDFIDGICSRCGENENNGDTPITSLRIDASTIVTAARGTTYTFSLILNEGANGNNVVWTIADPTLGTVDNTGKVTIFDKIGNVRLTAADPVSGLSHSIVLRIAS